MSWHELKEILDDFGYNPPKRMWYVVPKNSLDVGLTKMNTDFEVMEMAALGVKHEIMHVYVEADLKDDDISEWRWSADGNEEGNEAADEGGNEAEHEGGMAAEGDSASDSNVYSSDDEEYSSERDNDEFMDGRRRKRISKKPQSVAPLQVRHVGSDYGYGWTIRSDQQKRMAEKKDLFVGSIDALCPRIRLIVEENKERSRSCLPTHAGDWKFQVKEFVNTYVVDLPAKTCSCRKWNITGIPCPHAVSCIHYVRKDVDDYVRQVDESQQVEMQSHVNEVFVSQQVQMQRQVEVQHPHAPASTSLQSVTREVQESSTSTRALDIRPKLQIRRKERGESSSWKKRSATKVGPSVDALIRRELSLTFKGVGVLTGESGMTYIRMPGEEMMMSYKGRHGGQFVSPVQTQSSQVQ
ncbi:hypothetical protein CRG98_013480 [Punica granatum]|uniref:SWIM-type domain-containing protein n=1 Tax=Punica granatum TaxID=22663 RepID=A0A2I0KC80_PUNGR|nr:hypothetical protein CRG98_013480 [Punica granatum]